MKLRMPRHFLDGESYRLTLHDIATGTLPEPDYVAIAGDDLIDSDDDLESLLEALRDVSVGDVVIWERWSRVAALIVNGRPIVFAGAANGHSARKPLPVR